MVRKQFNQLEDKSTWKKRADDHNKSCMEKIRIKTEAPEFLQSPTLPLFSRCFQHTVLIWIPFLFVCLTAPVLIFQITVKQNTPLPWTRMLTAKLFITCLLILDSVFLFVLAFFEIIFSKSVNAVDFVYPLMICASMVTMVVFIMACQKHGRVTSGVITGIRNLSVPFGVFHYISFLVWYICVCAQVVLFSFADTPGEDATKPAETSLNLEDTSAYLVPRWNALWQKAMIEYNARKKKLLAEKESRSRAASNNTPTFVNQNGSNTMMTLCHYLEAILKIRSQLMAA
uniref:Uncharacterized protein n=1 Tax=Ditylenchus dipsaci TaxID=166011 RepID=A0A915D352_9BILA